MKIKFKDIHKRIAKALLEESKTIEELSEEIGESELKIGEEVKNLYSAGFLDKEEGYPPKWKLKEEIADKLRKIEEAITKNNFKIVVKATIEFNGVDEQLVLLKAKKVSEFLENEKVFKIISLSIADVVEVEDGLFSTFIEVDLAVKDFKTLIYFISFYLPTSIEILKPKELNVSIYELQEGASYLADVMQKYSSKLLEILTRKELEEFKSKMLFKAK